MPKLSALVTNGGYGTIAQALSAGIPIVAAGRTEDKAEVGARVERSGVGLAIPSQRPKVDELQAAVSQVLSEHSFRDRAQAISSEMAAIDTQAEILGLLTCSFAFIPRFTDQSSYVQPRRPTDVNRHDCSTILAQAQQQWSTIFSQEPK